MKIPLKVVFSLIMAACGGLGAGVDIYLRNSKFDNIEVSDEPGHDQESKSLSDSSTPINKSSVNTYPDGTFGKQLATNKFAPVYSSTSDSVFQNILLQGLLTFNNKPIVYQKDQLFTGNPVVTVSPQVRNISNKNFYLYGKQNDSVISSYKESCIAALQKPYTSSDSTSEAELKKLEQWCTQPKVKHVLSRHGFELIKDSDDFKEVIAGGWFKKDGNTKYWEKQSFIKKGHIDNFLGDKSSTGINSKSDVSYAHVAKLKYRCSAALERPFIRETFYMPKEYWEQDKTVTYSSRFLDEFQEAVIFCTKSRTAEKYIVETLKGKAKETSELDSQDVCYLANKVNDLKNLKTFDPFGGNGFWCAVKLLYKEN